MPKVRTRATYHHGDLRQALIDATLAIIVEDRDAANVSLRAAARRVGVSQAAPYRHFANKDALLAAVAEEGFQQLLTALDVDIGSDLNTINVYWLRGKEDPITVTSSSG